jgi:hypothetical protein
MFMFISIVMLRLFIKLLLFDNGNRKAVQTAFLERVIRGSLKFN